MATVPAALEGDLVLYVRAGCHLCDEGEALLRPLLASARRGVRVVDVDGDAEARVRYGPRVPVLVCGGRQLCWGRFDPTVLATWFRVRAPGRRPPAPL